MVQGLALPRVGENRGERVLKPKAGVLVTATWTLRKRCADGRGVEFVAADAVEGRLAPLLFERAMVAPVIPEPQAEKDHGDEHAVDYNSGGEFEHSDESETESRCHISGIQRREESRPDGAETRRNLMPRQSGRRIVEATTSFPSYGPPLNGAGVMVKENCAQAKKRRP